LESVLAKFLDPENDLSLLNKREVIIRVALVSDEVLSELGDERTRYSTVDAIIEEIEFAKKKLAREGYQNIKIEIYRYHHLPNFIGFLMQEGRKTNSPGLEKNRLIISSAKGLFFNDTSFPVFVWEPF